MCICNSDGGSNNLPSTLECCLLEDEGGLLERIVDIISIDMATNQMPNSASVSALHYEDIRPQFADRAYSPPIVLNIHRKFYRYRKAL